MKPDCRKASIQSLRYLENKLTAHHEGKTKFRKNNIKAA